MIWTIGLIIVGVCAFAALVGVWIERDAERFPAMDASPTDWHNAIEREFANSDDRRGAAREWGQL